MPEDQVLPEEFEAPALITEGLVILPHMEVKLVIKDAKSMTAARQALQENKMIVLLPLTTSNNVQDSLGILALIRNSFQTPQGDMQIVLNGLWRVRVSNTVENSSYVCVRFTPAEEKDDLDEHSEIMRKVRGQIDEFVRLLPGIPDRIIALLRSAKSPGMLADLCAYAPDLSYKERLDLLETLNGEERLEKISKRFEKQLNALRKVAAEKKISDCGTCAELADKAMRSEPYKGAELALAFLSHVVRDHTGEVLALLGEKYGPIFMKKRSWR